MTRVAHMKPQPLADSQAESESSVAPPTRRDKTVQPLEAVNVPDALLRAETVSALVGRSIRTICELVKQCKFPAPKRTDGGYMFWRAGDVKAYLASVWDDATPVIQGTHRKEAKP